VLVAGGGDPEQGYRTDCILAQMDRSLVKDSAGY
jgi:hypothetical protein